MTPGSGVDADQARLARLREELTERRASLPAHTVRVHQMVKIEELEELIAELEGRLGNRTAEGEDSR